MREQSGSDHPESDGSGRSYPVRLGFLPESHAIPDPERPGRRRAGSRTAAPYGDDRVEVHDCPAVDLDQFDPGGLDLLSAGFDTVDLSALEPLQQVCARVLAAGRIDDEDATAVRSALLGAVLPTGHGPDLEVLYLADEGFIMRTAGPNGLQLVGPRSVGMNGHGQATSVHVDQDVEGTPLAQLMDGRAPSLFVHESPDGSCRDAGMLLVNLWIPLRQVVQPLVLADGRTVDRRRHQLRYGLPTGSFLDRDEDQVVNDIYTLLHDPGQRWYLRSELDHRRGLVFNTLSTPHGAGVLPGEDVAERCYLTLEAAELAVAEGDPGRLEEVVRETSSVQPPRGTTPSLLRAITVMLDLLQQAGSDAAGVCGGGAAAWTAAAQAARSTVVRSSLELRMVVSARSEVPA